VLRDRGLDRVNELDGYLAKPGNQREEIDALNELAWELRVSQPERVRVLCKKAGELSQSGEFLEQPYIHGLAASLVGQAFVDTYIGNLETAVSQCLQAIALLGESRSHVGTRIWFTLGWTSFFLGDYPAALENGLKALELARGLGDRLHEAWALDAVASFQTITGDAVTAVPLHEDALKIFRSLHDVLGEMRALNNFAVSLLEITEYGRAYEEGLKSFQLAKESKAEADVGNNACTLADILVKMGRLEEAESYINEAFSYISGSGLVRVSLLERGGILRLMRDDLTGAESYILQALELASNLDQGAEQASCHQSLSEIYERQGRYQDALEHQKKYHKFQKILQGELAAKRLAVLKITHQVESARHEAEIYKLKTLELEQQVDEQKAIQSVLEIQSVIDPLTGLHNRRYFDDVLLKEYSRHSRSGADMSVLMLDVDHFKRYNDTYGHVSGDDCLRRIARVIRDSTSRPPDITARYGGEEFVCLLPETGLDGATHVAENIRKGIEDLGIPHATSGVARCVTISIGVISTKCAKDGSEVELVIKADEQLYLAKSHGRNRVEAVHI